MRKIRKKTKEKKINSVVSIREFKIIKFKPKTPVTGYLMLENVPEPLKLYWSNFANISTFARNETPFPSTGDSVCVLWAIGRRSGGGRLHDILGMIHLFFLRKFWQRRKQTFPVRKPTRNYLIHLIIHEWVRQATVWISCCSYRTASTAIARRISRINFAIRDSDAFFFNFTFSTLFDEFLDWQNSIWNLTRIFIREALVECKWHVSKTGVPYATHHWRIIIWRWFLPAKVFKFSRAAWGGLLLFWKGVFDGSGWLSHERNVSRKSSSVSFDLSMEQCS